MKIREKLYLSTTASDAVAMAKKYQVGLEIAEFCTAMFMDEPYFPKFDLVCREKLQQTSRHLMHAPFNELVPCAIEPRAVSMARQRLDEAYLLAKSYGINKMVVHSGHMPVLYFDEWFVEQSAKFWKEYMEDKPDLELFIENAFEEDPFALAQMVREVNCPRVKICFDLGHAHCKSKIPLEEWVEAFAGLVGHTHLHDNDQTYDWHKPLGQGNINYQKILPLLAEKFPMATYTLENQECEASLLWLEANGFL